MAEDITYDIACRIVDVIGPDEKPAEIITGLLNAMAYFFAKLGDDEFRKECADALIQHDIATMLERANDLAVHMAADGLDVPDSTKPTSH
jgi:hypothetical protein